MLPDAPRRLGVRVPDGDSEDPDRLPRRRHLPTRSRPSRITARARASRPAVGPTSRSGMADRARPRRFVAAAPRRPDAPYPRLPRTAQGSAREARPPMSDDRTRPGRAGTAETVAGFLAAFAIFVASSALAWHPLRLIVPAIVLALVAAGMADGEAARFAAVLIGAACFFLGLTITVVTCHRSGSPAAAATTESGGIGPRSTDERGLRRAAPRAVPRQSRVRCRTSGARSSRARREPCSRMQPGPRAAARALDRGGNGHAPVEAPRPAPPPRRLRLRRLRRAPPDESCSAAIAAGDVAREGVPHARAPRRASRSARLGAARRPRARAGAADPEADARAAWRASRRSSCASTSRARRSPTRYPRLREIVLRARSPTRSSTSPTTRSASGCGRRSSRAATASRSTDERAVALLARLSQVEGMEHYLRRAFLGQKQFSIEGLDVMVPMLDEAIELAADAGAHEVVIGMAHRGRLNVLAHVVGRPYEVILREFEGERTIEAVVVERGGRQRRREVPPRRRGHARDARRRDHGHARVEPEPPRGRRPGRRGPRARGADRPLDARGLPRPDRRAAGPHPRRRVVRRPGRGRGDAQPRGPRRLLDRRHAPPDREQPGRLHDRPARRPLDALLERPREGLRRPDHPRQRRRPGGGALGDPARAGVSRAASATTSSSISSATAGTGTTSRTRPRTRSRCSPPRSPQHPTVREQFAAQLVDDGRDHEEQADELEPTSSTQLKAAHEALKETLRRARPPPTAGRAHPGRDRGARSSRPSPPSSCAR